MRRQLPLKRAERDSPEQHEGRAQVQHVRPVVVRLHTDLPEEGVRGPEVAVELLGAGYRAPSEAVDRAHQALEGEAEVGHVGQEVHRVGHVGVEDEEAGHREHHRDGYRAQEGAVLEKRERVGFWGRSALLVADLSGATLLVELVSI